MFFERLIALCEKKGIRPNTVAKAIGLSSAVATKWKAGTLPNGETLCKIADYLDCSVDYLLGRDSDAAFSGDAHREAYAILSRLSDDDCKEAIRYLEYLAERKSNRD